MRVARLLRVQASGVVTVFAVATPYAWEVAESVLRRGDRVRCVDNLGSADPALPGLTTTALDDGADTPFVLGVASPRARAGAALAALAAGLRTPVALVDPTAVLASSTTTAHGAYVNAGAVVGSQTHLGCHSHVNRSASVGHHCRLGFAAHVGPGVVLAGGVDVGQGAFVGAGATVLPERRIGRGAVVGAGAVVTRDVADGDVVIGNPALVIRSVPPDPGAISTCPHCSAT
jgi:sugar O-acyltransferase (sialic acid O-acetyltransferase NeuD family)